MARSLFSFSSILYQKQSGQQPVDGATRSQMKLSGSAGVPCAHCGSNEVSPVPAQLKALGKITHTLLYL